MCSDGSSKSKTQVVRTPQARRLHAKLSPPASGSGDGRHAQLMEGDSGRDDSHQSRNQRNDLMEPDFQLLQLKSG